MAFVKNFTQPNFHAKNFAPSIHLISAVLVRKTQKMSENGEIYTAGKNFTLPPAVTAWTNSTSGRYWAVLSGTRLNWVVLYCIWRY